FYRQVFQALQTEEQNQLDTLFASDPTTKRTLWNDLRQDAGPPTLKQLQRWTDRMTWLSGLNMHTHALAGIPDIKIKQFATEAKSLDAARMVALEPYKRATLAVSLLAVQSARV